MNLTLITVLTMLGGPVLSANDADLAQDAFPASGAFQPDTPARRYVMDVRFSMARDVIPGLGNAAGDSILVTVIPGGSAITEARIVWVLDKNPLFEDAIRQVPSRPEDLAVDATDPLRWRGEALGSPPFLVNGIPYLNLWAFDLPDVDFLYPGDVLRYCIVATDGLGQWATLPADTTGISTGRSYSRRFTVRALPSLGDVTGTQPSTLAILSVSDATASALIWTSLEQAGYSSGADLDVYTERAAESLVGNGIGSAGQHGANVFQLGGYSTLLVFTDARASGILSDETRSGTNDESDDLRRLQQWSAQPGPRHVAYFGDSFASGLTGDSAQGASYVANRLGVQVISGDLGSGLEGQNHPDVVAVALEFSQGYIVDRVEPSVAKLDQLTPLSGAVRTHAYVDLGGGAYPGFAAAMVHDRLDLQGDRKVDLSFGSALARISTPQTLSTSTLPARARLLREVRAFFGDPAPIGVTSTGALVFVGLRVAPNPFWTEVAVWTLDTETDWQTVIVYDIRGRRVRREDVELRSGGRLWSWDGRDETGREVARGLYFLEFQSPARVEVLSVRFQRR